MSRNDLLNDCVLYLIHAKNIWKSTGYLPNRTCCELVIIDIIGFRIYPSGLCNSQLVQELLLRFHWWQHTLFRSVMILQDRICSLKNSIANKSASHWWSASKSDHDTCFQVVAFTLFTEGRISNIRYVPSTLVLNTLIRFKQWAFSFLLLPSLSIGF